MAKFSHKQMGKENGSASEYAQPHTMKGKSIDGTEGMKAGEYVSNKSAKTATIKDPLMSGVSYGVGETKTDGIKIRGTGAATKGVMARGPMA